MNDYARRVVDKAAKMPAPLALCGWSMGGLVALMATAETMCSCLVLIEGSPPGEVQGFDPSIEPRVQSFDAEEVYGAFPSGIRSRPESQLARDERKRGISVPSVPCPTLMISGMEFPIERGQDLANFYDAKLVEFPRLSHWDLILDGSVRQKIREFIGI